MFAARKFAEDKKDRYTVALLSRENHTPFCPKKLVQALADRTAPESALMQDEQWFRENDQTLMLNTNVTQVDMKTRLLVGERRDPGSGKSTPVRVRAKPSAHLSDGGRGRFLDHSCFKWTGLMMLQSIGRRWMGTLC
eukprot:c20726_g3_i3.p1 GENE.c20726_g3_i3~~c20726_g3_i3.p1  ORF type:complete len:151 (-),score=23.60 c20726_g3_i3:276-686(-)